MSNMLGGYPTSVPAPVRPHRAFWLAHERVREKVRSVADPAHPSTGSGTESWTPAQPLAALLPGVLLVFAGLWMVTDNGPLALGWACFAVGIGFVLVGAVAWGVAWGMDLHDHRRP
jgi:hypothetical protein